MAAWSNPEGAERFVAANRSVAVGGAAPGTHPAHAGVGPGRLRAGRRSPFMSGSDRGVASSRAGGSARRVAPDARASSRRVRPTVLVGPAGIGKTTLARAALDGPGGYREAGALASLAWSPLLVFRRLLRDDPPELPDEVAAAVMAQGSSAGAAR